eukprot:395615_1
MSRRPKKKVLVKIIIIGESGVGKTAILHQYVMDKFIQEHKATIGADFLTKEVNVQDKVVTLQIWDTAGQERFQSLGNAFYRGADACILVYDVTDEESFKAIDHWRENFIAQAGIDNINQFPFLLLGNKCDCNQQRKVSIMQGKEYADMYNMQFYEVSAKMNTNVCKAMREFVLYADEISGDCVPFFSEEVAMKPLAQAEQLQSGGGMFSGLFSFGQKKASTIVDQYTQYSYYSSYPGDALDETSSEEAEQECMVIRGKRSKIEEFDMREEMKSTSQQFYQELSSTKEYQETGWYKVKYEDGSKSLIKLNKFWCDYGEYLLGDKDDDYGKQNLEFLSKWVLLPTSNVHEIICCLSLLNLSFENNGGVQYKYIKNENTGKMPLKLACNAMKGSIVFVKELVVDNDNDAKQQDLISVNISYSDINDEYLYGDDGGKYDKFINPENDKFYGNKVYCCLIVLTNISSIEQNLKVFVEIPHGSIPCGKGNYYNKTHFITIPSYSTQKISYRFYFPYASSDDNKKYYSFPIIISKYKNNKIIAWTKAQKLNVQFLGANKMEIKEDKQEVSKWESWKKISVVGNYNDILSFLQKNNIQRMIKMNLLSRIYYLFGKNDSVSFWESVIKLLSSKFIYDRFIWSYSLKYKSSQQTHIQSLFEFLMNTSCKIYFAPFFYISNEINYKKRAIKYFEYFPLINSRIHSLG